MAEYDLRKTDKEQDFEILLIDGTTLPPVDTTGHSLVGVADDGRGQPMVDTLEKFHTVSRPGSVKHLSENGLLLDVVPITSIARFKLKDKVLKAINSVITH